MPFGQFLRLRVGQADQRVDEDLDDLLGRGVGDFLDVHAAFAGGHQRHLLRRAVGDHRNVVFLLDVGAVLDQQPAHFLAQRAGLVRDQLHAQDLAGQRLDLVDRAGQLDAAALAAATGVDLGLDDPDRAAELLGGFHRLLHGEGRDAARHRHTEVAQDFLALVLVNLHEGSLEERWGCAQRQGAEGSSRVQMSASNCIMVQCTKNATWLTVTGAISTGRIHGQGLHRRRGRHHRFADSRTAREDAAGSSWSASHRNCARTQPRSAS